MRYSQTVIPAIIVTSIVTLQPITAKALSSQEVGKIAEGITVLIDYKDNPDNGSGVIIKKDGNTYTVLTAAHVVGNPNRKYEIVAPDNQRYSLEYKSVRKLPSEIDLAVFTFNSSNNYQVAKIGNSDTSERGTLAYISGFPGKNAVIDRSILNVTEGKVAANSKQPLSNGYGLIYNITTVEGMSGGAVLNEKGELIGIHGRGNIRYDEQTDTIQKSGLNLGISINTFVRLSNQVGVNTGVTAPKLVATALTAEDYLARGVNKNNKQDYKGAIADFNQAINRNPNYAEAFVARGAARGFLKDYQRAIQDFSKAIQINPQYDEAYNNRGVARGFLKDYQGAIKDFTQATQINPQHHFAYYNRGNVRKDLKDYQEATKYFTKAIQLNPQYAEAYSNRGVIRRKLKDYQEATKDYTKAIQINPQFAYAYKNRGINFSDLKDYQAAIKDFTKASELFKQQGNQEEYQRILKDIEYIKQKMQ